MILVLPGFAVFAVDTAKIDIRADVFGVDAKTSVLIASGNVVVKRQDMIVKATRGRYDQAKQVVVLFDDVVLTKGAMVLNCDQITVYGRDNRVDAEGHGVFHSGTIHGQSDKVVYELNREFVTLTGYAQAWQGADEISGDTVGVDLRRKQFTTRGKARVKLSKDRLSK